MGSARRGLLLLGRCKLDTLRESPDRDYIICGGYRSTLWAEHVSSSIEHGSQSQKDGVKHYTTEIIANDMQLLGRRADSTPGAPAPSSAAKAAAPQNEDPFAAEGSDDGLPF